MHVNMSSLFLDTNLLPDGFCAFVSFSNPDSTNFTSQGLVCQSKSRGGLKSTPHSVLCCQSAAMLPVSSNGSGQRNSTIWQVWVSLGTKEKQLQPHTLLNCPRRGINATPSSGHGSDTASFSRGVHEDRGSVSATLCETFIPFKRLPSFNKVKKSCSSYCRTTQILDLKNLIHHDFTLISELTPTPCKVISACLIL